MKRIIYILSAFLMVLSCEVEMVEPALNDTGNNGPGVPGEKPSVRPDDVPEEGKNFNFMMYEDESVLLDLNPHLAYRQINFAISQSWDISSDPWIFVVDLNSFKHIYSGYPGNHTIYLYFDRNMTETDREGYVTFTSKGGTKKLKVSQKKYEYYKIGPEGGDIVIPVGDNVRYSYEVKDWFKFYHDEENKNYVISVSEKKSGNERIANINMWRYSGKNDIEAYQFTVLQYTSDFSKKSNRINH